MRTIKVQSIQYVKRGVKYPFVRLGGRWLEEAGIKYGEKVNIEIINDMVIIKQSRK